MQLPRAPGGVRSASDNCNSRRAGSKGVLRQAMSELVDPVKNRRSRKRLRIVSVVMSTSISLVSPRSLSRPATTEESFSGSRPRDVSDASPRSL